MNARVIVGDCRDAMRAMDANSIDATVTDPPYGIGFMGKGWDHSVPGVEFWTEALRVMKPGAYLCAFGGTRTFHRQVCAIEDAGFEIHDCLTWLYGSGFPKHKSKLKPAWEPITLARKPAKNATLLNIAAGRIGFVSASDEAESKGKNRHGDFGSAPRGTRGIYGADDRARGNYDEPGRWPANVVLDEEAGAAIDAQSGDLAAGNHPANRQGIGYHSSARGTHGERVPTDAGGASRFFYCAKPTRAERDEGLHGTARRPGGAHRHGEGSIGSKGGRDRPVHNHHPTVKPVSLMRWLARLVTPEGGIILDPFCGSGTTGCAAVAEGFRFIGCELSAEYAAIAEARINATPLSLFGAA